MSLLAFSIGLAVRAPSSRAGVPLAQPHRPDASNLGASQYYLLGKGAVSASAAIAKALSWRPRAET